MKTIRVQLIVVVSATLIAALLYFGSIRAIRRYHPGYPGRVMMAIYTPNSAVHIAHGLAPILGLMGLPLFVLLYRNAQNATQPSRPFVSPLSLLYVFLLAVSSLLYIHEWWRVTNVARWLAPPS